MIVSVFITAICLSRLIQETFSHNTFLYSKINNCIKKHRRKNNSYKKLPSYISITSCLKAIRIMYNRVYFHITKHLLLYDKQFGFEASCSTEYAILQLTKGIYKAIRY